MHGGRGRDHPAAEERAPGEGAEADRHPAGGSQLGAPPGPDPGGHEPHAGEAGKPWEIICRTTQHQLGFSSFFSFNEY